jgi:hypothetical protein
MHGFFELKTPTDLLHKLEREYERWKADPLNVDLAWNFFVTAEHLPDWLGRTHTGSPLLGGDSINKFRTERPLLRICSHLENGGKHLTPNSKQHSSVDHAVCEMTGVFEDGVFEDDVFADKPALRVYLTPNEQAALGRDTADVEALWLAGRIMEFWQAWPALNTKP